MIPSLIRAWITAHPFEALIALGAILSVINGALPASVKRGPVGRVLLAALDRLAVLTRSDAAGTLKWPGVASALLAVPPSPPVAPPSVGPLAPPDPVAPALPTPVEPSPMLRASTLTGRETMAPADDSVAAYELARREVAASGVFDAGARQTIAPDVVAAARRASDDGQRGSVETGAVGYLLVLAAVVLAAVGCPASRQLTRPALGDVDGCEPRATRCSPTGRPQVCSGSRRWTDADVVCVTAGQVAAVCCLTTSPITGAELHACVTADRCLPDAGR